MAPSRSATLVSVALDAAQGPALYVQLFEQVRDLILDGRLRPGQRLPSTRALAKDLDVSRTTTLAAYEQLTSEGYIEGREGSGAYVAAMLPEDLLLVTRPDTAGNTCARAKPATVPGETEAARPFSNSAQDVHLFPFADWSRLLARTWRVPDGDLIHHMNAFGHWPLRAAIAGHLQELRGIRCDAEQVVITASADQAVALLIETLLGHDGAVHVEDPGYPAIYRALGNAGVDVRPVPVDDSGLMVERAQGSSAGAQAAIITPSRQYPLGMTMPLARRLEVLNWAEEAGVWIVEDDYDSEYRYVGRPLSALMSLDRSGRVIYLGSFSKTMFKSLRLGFVVLPQALVAQMTQGLASAGTGASTVAQPALAEFISSGQFAAHIRRMRRIYSERQKVLREILERDFADRFEVPRQSAGMHLPAFFSEKLAVKLSDVAASERLAARGITAEPLSPHYRKAAPRQGLLLGFAGFVPDEIRKAARIMSEVLV